MKNLNTTGNRTARLPRIIVLSKDTDDEFNWMSDGWNTMKNPNVTLFAKVKRIIASGENVPDVIRKLEVAGFSVRKVN